MTTGKIKKGRDSGKHNLTKESSAIYSRNLLKGPVSLLQQR